MFKVEVSVIHVYGSKGPGYLASWEGVSAYHPSYDVSLALLREQLVQAGRDLGWSEEVVVVSKV